MPPGINNRKLLVTAFLVILWGALNKEKAHIPPSVFTTGGLLHNTQSVNILLQFTKFDSLFSKESN